MAIIEGKSDQIREDRYYSSQEKEDPGVRGLVAIMEEFDDIRAIEADAAISVTVNTKEEWDRLWKKPDTLSIEEIIGKRSSPLNSFKDLSPAMEMPFPSSPSIDTQPFQTQQHGHHP